jgi:hypothetical protein
MRKTTLILAGAVAFDLGVMAVSAQAQQAGPAPPPASGPTGSGQAARSARIPGPSEAGAQFTQHGGSTANSAGLESVGAAQPGSCARGKHIPDSRVDACRAPGARGSDPASISSEAAPADPPPRQAAAAADYYLKLTAAYPARSCIAARGHVVTHEGVQQCRLPGPATPRDSQDFRTEGHLGVADDSDIYKQGASLNFAKIDTNYTARACIAQRGEVVTREGVQQCALPDPASASPGRERRQAAPALPRE